MSCSAWADELETNFLIRTCISRLAQDGDRISAAQMKKTVAKGRHSTQAKDKTGELYEAELEIKFEQSKMLPPIGKRQDYSELTLTVIHTLERGTPGGVRKLHGN